MKKHLERPGLRYPKSKQDAPSKCTVVHFGIEDKLISHPLNAHLVWNIKWLLDKLLFGNNKQEGHLLQLNEKGTYFVFGVWD